MTTRKIELQANPSNPDRPFGHLLPIVDALIKAGNSPTGADRFYLTQDGWYCTLSKPIDFDVVKTEFDIPDSVVLVENRDQIWCRNTWVCIHGADSVQRSSAAYEEATMRPPSGKF